MYVLAVLYLDFAINKTYQNFNVLDIYLGKSA